MFYFPFLISKISLKWKQPVNRILRESAVEIVRKGESYGNQKWKNEQISSICLTYLIKLIMLYQRVIRFCFTTISKREVQESNYNDLVNKIVREYNYQQYKNPSALALLEVHHNYKIFNAGDWVLDLGAGPTYSWTDLALKMCKNDDNSHRIISNDIGDCQVKKENNYFVRGDFFKEPVRTKIAMNLIDRPLDSILIDATGNFTGNPSLDGDYSSKVFLQALEFSGPYLKKGGRIIFKTIESPSTSYMHDKLKFFFNEVYKFKPSSLRISSPSFFYVVKGYLMTNNFDGADKFLKEYKGSASKKIAVVEKYKKVYQWDPIFLVENEAKKRILDMKQNGRSNKDIMKVFEDDPFVKAKQLIKIVDLMQDENQNPVARMKAINKFKGLTDDPIMEMPETQEDFAEDLLKKVDEMTGKKPKEEKVDPRAPLGDDEIYLKNKKIDKKQNRLQELDYREEDLYGFRITEETPEESMKGKSKDQIEMMKILKSFPEVEEALKSQDVKNSIMNSPEIKKHYTKKDVEDLESLLKGDDSKDREAKSGDKFDVDLDDWVSKTDKTDANIRSIYEREQEEKMEYINQEIKKSDRYINQKRSKRHLKNRNKF